MNPAPATQLSPPAPAPRVVGFYGVSPRHVGALIAAGIGSLAIVIAGPLPEGVRVFVSQPRTDIVRVKPRRSTELAWRRGNAEWLRREYPGQWIVLEGEEIVAVGPDPARLVEQARRQGIRSPYVFRVERETDPRTSVLGV